MARGERVKEGRRRPSTASPSPIPTGCCFPISASPSSISPAITRPSRRSCCLTSRRRPISLVRCPEGYTKECFFQRHAMKGMSDTIKEVPIPGGESKKKYLYIDGEAGLFGLVQIGVLEIHDWGVSLDHIDKPDRIVFDLDPDEGLDSCHAESRRGRGARLPRRSRLQELPQIDRRQRLAYRRADHARSSAGTR